MPPLLAILHAAQEGLGTIDPFLRSENIPVEICHTYLGNALPLSIKPYAGLIVMGGAMNVDETEKYPFLKTECELIRKAVESDKPVLGICLGAQLLAKALGSRVYPGHQKEVGWQPIFLTDAGCKDPVFSAFTDSKSQPVFHWHGDTFELPKNSALLASSEQYPNQAFSYKNNAYGLQFHIEITHDMIRQWVKADQEWLKSAPLKSPPESIIQTSKMHLPKLEFLAKNFYRRYFDHVGLLKKKTIHNSPRNAPQG